MQLRISTISSAHPLPCPPPPSQSASTTASRYITQKTLTSGDETITFLKTNSFLMSQRLQAIQPNRKTIALSADLAHKTWCMMHCENLNLQSRARALPGRRRELSPRDCLGIHLFSLFLFLFSNYFILFLDFLYLHSIMCWSFLDNFFMKIELKRYIKDRTQKLYAELMRKKIVWKILPIKITLYKLC